MVRTALVISIRARTGRRPEVREVWDRHLRARVEECVAQQLYLVVEDEADADALHLIEVYNDPTVAQRNASAPWFAAYLREVGPLLDGRPTMLSGGPVWSKGLAG